MLSEILSWICVIGLIWFLLAHIFFLRFGKIKLYIDYKRKWLHILILFALLCTGVIANKLNTNKGPISIEKINTTP